MSNSMHRCNFMPTFISVELSKNSIWYAKESTRSSSNENGKTITTETFIPIFYCPYCGERLRAPEHDMGLKDNEILYKIERCSGTKLHNILNKIATNALSDASGHGSMREYLEGRFMLTFLEEELK